MGKTKKKDKKAAKSSEKPTVSLPVKKSKKSRDKNAGGVDPNALRQELEVMIKNLNKDGQLAADKFVLRDDDVSDVDDAPLSDDEKQEDVAEEVVEDYDAHVEDNEKNKATPDAAVIQSDEVSSSTSRVESETEAKKDKKKKKKSKKDKKTKDDEVKTEEAGNQPVVEAKNDADYSFLKDHIVRKNCVVKPGKWFEASPCDEFDEDTDLETNDYWLAKIEKYAAKLLEAEVENFRVTQKKDSEKQWLNTVIKSGTLTDKISAYNVLLQESAVQNLQALEALIGNNYFCHAFKDQRIH